ncbi:MAG: NAD(P)H-binding protein [Nocardioides sp.]
MTRLLVAGATGFIGRRLVPALVEAGHDVRAMTRNPKTYDGPGQAVGGDVADPSSLAGPLDGVEVAYYLVHSLDSDDFERRDAEAARNFARAAARAGVRRIVYLGGLGSSDGELSAHLRSRREVETLLGGSGVPVTVLRAAIIVGHGGISWEITRQLVKNLPAMVVPRWAGTRTQPIALDDVIGYLTGVLEQDETTGEVYEIGGPEVLTYAEMMQRAAKVLVDRRVVMVQAPVLTPRLSSYWLALVTDVDVTTGRNLIDSMGTEVVVSDDRIRRLIERDLVGYDDAVRRALEDRREGVEHHD